MPLSNPERILRVLDSHLERETRIVLFGRAALAMGFGSAGIRFGKTVDVDAILPTVEMEKIEADDQFWKAIELTNKSLVPDGLYISHLFTDKQVALTPDWLSKIVPIEANGFKNLRLFRPSSVDLVLTKMMRNDRQDIEDIRFILAHERVERADIEKAFAAVRPHEVRELQQIFVEMQPLVRGMAAPSKGLRENLPGGDTKLDSDWWLKLTQPLKEPPAKERDREIER
jgi:hypothetical protein